MGCNIHLLCHSLFDHLSRACSIGLGSEIQKVCHGLIAVFNNIDAYSLTVKYAAHGTSLSQKSTSRHVLLYAFHTLRVICKLARTASDSRFLSAHHLYLESRTLKKYMSGYHRRLPVIGRLAGLTFWHNIEKTSILIHL